MAGPVTCWHTVCCQGSLGKASCDLASGQKAKPDVSSLGVGQYALSRQPFPFAFCTVVVCSRSHSLDVSLQLRHLTSILESPCTSRKLQSTPGTPCMSLLLYSSLSITLIFLWGEGSGLDEPLHSLSTAFLFFLTSLQTILCFISSLQQRFPKIFPKSKNFLPLSLT